MTPRRLAAMALVTLVQVPASLDADRATQHSIERDGQKLCLWGREPADGTSSKAVIFLHGGTWSALPNFDLPVRDYSVLRQFAQRGWSAFGLDVQGYGCSDDPAGESWSRATDAVLDLEAAVDFVRKRTGIARVHLVGLSWGGQVAGLYAMRHPDRVAGLALSGVLWGRDLQIEFPSLERFREATEESAARDFSTSEHDEDVREAFVRECLERDPSSPSGCLQDYTELPILDPERISVPCLVAFGEKELTQETFSDSVSFFHLLAARRKQFSIIGGAGHAAHLDRTHLEWIVQIDAFLSGAPACADED